MASTQRADRYEQLYKALKKHYKPVTPPTDRKVLDHLLYACCLEDATYEAADEAFAKLQQAYFDSNEVRVTTTAELSESMTSLPKAAAAANRIKKSLQSMFEARYSYDIDDLKKANLGKAVDELTGWQGMSKYAVDYITQHALGGHAIPISQSILDVCQTLELITYAEAEKGSLPGVERAIAKSKGFEFASMLHQFAIDYAVSFKNPTVMAVFKDMGMVSKAKAPPPPPPAPKPTKTEAAAKEAPKSKGKTPPPPSTHAKEEAKAAKPAEKTAIKKVAADPVKTGKQTKMVPVSKPVAKSVPVNTKSKPVVKKEAPTAKTSKAKPGATPSKKTAPKPPAKPTTKPAAKPTTKKVEVKVKKTADKKSIVSPKTKSKPASAASKAPAKRLPVKPATNKKTKPK
jgi:hypothetical protein